MGLLLPLLAQLTITVAAPDTVAVLEPIMLTVEMSAPSTRPPRLVAPDFAELSVGRTTASTYVERSSGSARVHVEIRYVLEAARPGEYVVAPFEARLGGESVRSRATRIVVRGAGGATVPTIVAKAPFDASASVSVAATVNPDTVYVGEQTTYQVAVFIDEAIRNRLRRNPGFTPPELRGMLAYELSPLRGSLPTRKVGDRRFEPHLYQRAVFPLVAGRHVIPPAELHYALPLSYSFFSREESRVLRTDSIVLIARETPLEGRPANYSGAVGELAIAAEVRPARARVGDPAVLTLTVSGVGNINMLPRPTVELPWGLLIPAQERVTIDRSSEVIRGAKEFDWVITPQMSGPQELPAIQYPFFNPRTEQYEIAVSRADTLTIVPGGLVGTDEPEADTMPLLPLRTTYRGEQGAPLHSKQGYWLLLATAPVPAAFVALVRRPRRRRVPSAASILRGLGARRGKLTPGELRRAYVNALAQRLHLGAGMLATRTDFARALRRAGVSSQTTDLATALLAELDGAAYGMRPAALSALLDRAQKSYRAVDAEARALPQIPTTTVSVLLAVAISVAGVGGLAASAQDEGRALFQRGAREYQARRFGEAVRSFGELTRVAPDAPDGWANFGTAAWAAGDTAAAVVGWQRALRLEPIAVDVRSRLTLVRSTGIRSFAWVPPVSMTMVAIAIAALWLAAWLMALVRAAGRTTVSRNAIIGTASIALLLIAGGMLLDERLAAKRLSVVGETTMLRAVPALGGDAVLNVHPGEVVRTLSRRGEWVLVELDRGREGWIEAPMLVSIARN